MQRKCLFFLSLALCIYSNVFAQDGQGIVEGSFDYIRGRTSISLVDMTVHRPDWERVFSIRGWTEGQDKSLIRIIAPAKDNGNATLKIGREMWIYNPKVNRVIKIPPSMMSQSWMGSDFSNNDLAKSDSLLKDYSHSIVGEEMHEGKKIYLIKSVPIPHAPVIWGMQRLKIREDHIFLEQEFYDEDLKPVKKLSGLQIQMMGGKLFPKVWKMQKSDAKEEYTLLEYREILFDEELPERLFSLSSLKSLKR